MFVVESIHITVQTSKDLNENKFNSLQRYVLNRRRFPIFTEWMAFSNCFLNHLSVKNTSLYENSVTI